MSIAFPSTVCFLHSYAVHFQSYALSVAGFALYNRKHESAYKQAWRSFLFSVMHGSLPTRKKSSSWKDLQSYIDSKSSYCSKCQWYYSSIDAFHTS